MNEQIKINVWVNLTDTNQVFLTELDQKTQLNYIKVGVINADILEDQHSLGIKHQSPSNLSLGDVAWCTTKRRGDCKVVIREKMYIFGKQVLIDSERQRLLDVEKAIDAIYNGFKFSRTSKRDTIVMDEETYIRFVKLAARLNVAYKIKKKQITIYSDSEESLEQMLEWLFL